MSYGRRGFLRRAAGASATAALSLGWRGQVFAQSPGGAAHIYIDPLRLRSALDPRLFGSFLEHLGRAIYQGIFEPGSPLADAAGYRTDVVREVRDLGVPIIRYPGGNFVSGYNWLDGVGPVRNRPRQLDKAWNSIESNGFGTNEFLKWCQLVGTEPLMGLNLGTGTPESAAALLEYCNVAKGTQWSELRRQHGVADPYNVRHWCLGNEMDGPWQIGHMSATEYGLKAADAARQMRAVDPSVRLIACGSSGPTLPTYLEWDREVLEQCYDYVDGLSLHRYMGNTAEETGGDSARYLALNLSMDRQIAETRAVCDFVRAHKRSPKSLWLSFDEWNVWYRARGGKYTDGARQEAPHLLEEQYNLEDALLVGGMLNTLMRNADRVKIGCLAQLVNVIAPLMTTESGLYRQSIFYPYQWALRYARGSVLDLLVTSSDYDVPGLGRVPFIDAAGTLSADGRTTTVFILNRDLKDARQIQVHWPATAPTQVAVAQVLTGPDLKAGNTADAPQRVKPAPLDRASSQAQTSTLEIPARAYAVVQWLNG